MISTVYNWQRVVDYYNDTASLIADDAKAMGWSSTFNQQLRFDVINYMVDLTGKSVLDVGCGDGALFHYLKNQAIDCDYTGIDLSPKMIQRAQSRFPGLNVRTKDFFSESNNFDVVICSGALSMIPNDDALLFLQTAMSHLFEIAQQHLVVNLLTDFYPSNSSLFQRYHPNDVLALCFKLTPYVTLNHSYLPNDFTVHLSKVNA